MYFKYFLFFAQNELTLLPPGVIMCWVEVNSTGREVRKMTDTNALRSAIVNSGLKYKALAEIMGLSPYALQMKIDNKSEFKASEIDTLANTLGMDMQQRDAIFFCRKSGI
jgi:hypothetical protein